MRRKERGSRRKGRGGRGEEEPSFPPTVPAGLHLAGAKGLRSEGNEAAGPL